MENKHLKTFALIALLAVIVVILALVITNNHKKAVQDQVVGTSNQAGNADITTYNLANQYELQLPYTVKGEVTGNWFFEASFPVVIKNAAGVTIATALATTTADWMTLNKVPFTVQLPAVDYHGAATIVFQKDNPSGEAKFDASLAVPVMIK